MTMNRILYFLSRFRLKPDSDRPLLVRRSRINQIDTLDAFSASLLEILWAASLARLKPLERGSEQPYRLISARASHSGEPDERLKALDSYETTVEAACASGMIALRISAAPVQ
jgi:hypothetical protein